MEATAAYFAIFVLLGYGFWIAGEYLNDYLQKRWR